MKISSATVLAVDDDATSLRVLSAYLKRCGIEVITASGGAQALELLEQRHCDLLISDLRMPEMDGIELLQEIRRRGVDIPFIIVTACGSIESAVDAMRQGAFDYLEKPYNFNTLLFMVQRALDYHRTLSENRQIKEYLQGQFTFQNIITANPAMKEMLEMATKVASFPRTTVAIYGESGTGKEVIARAIHNLSPRKSAAFVRVNCAALTESLLESELFGHEKGAFTGAVATKPGQFQLAEHGTLLLDEIADMPLNLQAKLLRVLQEGEVQRVGGALPQRVDVRLLAATNRDLEAEVEAGRFRADLYYRLAVICIELPPLRQRADDVTSLAQYFLRRFALQNGKPTLALSHEAMAALQSYAWPGNVRELENAMERAVVLARGETIMPSDLPERVARSEGGRSEISFAAGTPLEEIERMAIAETLRLTSGDKRRAAALLGIAVRTLYRRIGEQDEKR